MIIYGSCSGSSGGRYSVWLDVVQNSQNIGNNTSNITVSLKLKRNDGYAASAWNGYVNQNTVKLTVNGSVVVNTNMTFDTRDGKTATLGKWTGNVSHDSDGKYSKTIKGEFTTGNTGVSSGLSQGTFTASTIARASSLTLSNSSRNPTQDITATISMSAAFTHKITYKIGAYSSVNTVSAGVTQHLFTIPQSWANAVTTSTAGTVSVTLQTLSGSTVIGTKAYSFSLKIPDTAAYRPAFNVFIQNHPNGAESNWNTYVQGKSGVSARAADTDFKYSASFKSVTYTVGAASKTEARLFEPPEFPLPKDGTVQVSVKVTDTRGLSTTKTTNITVHKYAPPTAVFTYLERVEEDGVNSIGFKFLATVSPVDGKNTRQLFVQYRKLGGEWREAERLEIVDLTHTTAMGFCSTNITAADTYEVRLSCADAFTSTVTYGKIGTELCAFNIKKGGTGAAFGKYAEMDNVLEIDYDLKVNGRCDERLLWSGTLTKDQECTLLDDLWNYRFVKFKAGTFATYPLSTVYSGTSPIRAIGSFAGEGLIEIQAIRGTYTKPSDIPTFKLEMMTSFNVSTSGITNNNAAYTNITEIWGIK